MKNSMYRLLVALMAWVLVSCGGGDSGQTGQKALTKVPKPDLGNQSTAIKAVDQYLTRNFEQGKIFLPVQDEVEKKEVFLSPPIGYDSIAHQLSENVVSLGVQMHPNDSKTDLYLVDFTCEWDEKLLVNDSTQGGIKVAELKIRSVNGKPRYKWNKQGKYWDKIPVVVQ
jgi:hypothetical protein